MGLNQTLTTPEIRIDRAELRKPRLLDDGTKIYEARLAIADQPLSYDWGEETPTREALSSNEYLEGLRGLSIIAQHVKTGRLDGRAPKIGDGRRIGSAISARFDADNGEVIVELAIPEKDDQQLVERNLREVSEGYTPVIERGDDGVNRQVKRVPNHIAVTDRGRAKGAKIRVDSLGVSLTTEEAMEKIEQMAAEIASLKVDLQQAASGGAVATGQVEQVSAEKAALELILQTIMSMLGGGVRADSESICAKIKEKIVQEGQAVADLRLRADSLKVQLPESALDSDSIRKALALGLGGEEKRCDSAEYCDGIIFAASKQENIGKSVPIRHDSVVKTDYPF